MSEQNWPRGSATKRAGAEDCSIVPTQQIVKKHKPGSSADKATPARSNDIEIVDGFNLRTDSDETDATSR